MQCFPSSRHNISLLKQNGFFLGGEVSSIHKCLPLAFWRVYMSFSKLYTGSHIGFLLESSGFLLTALLVQCSDDALVNVSRCESVSLAAEKFPWVPPKTTNTPLLSERSLLANHSWRG